MAKLGRRVKFNHKKKKSGSDCQELSCSYRVLLEKTREIIFLVDPFGLVTYINPAISRFGGSPDQIIGRKYTDLVAPEDCSLVEAFFQHSLAGQSESVDFHLLVDSHNAISVRATSEPIYENGVLVGVAGKILETDLGPSFEKILEKRAVQLTLLNAMGEKISSVLEIDQILAGAVELLQISFGYYHVAVFIPDPETGDALMTARAGSFAARYPSDHRLKRGLGMVGWVCENHRTLLANDVRRETTYVNLYPERIPSRSELSVPILAGDNLAGVLDLQSPLENAFDEDDVCVIETVANQLAVAMVNARLYAEVRLRLREQEHAQGLVRLQRDLLGELSSVHDYQTTLEAVVTSLKLLDGVDCGSLYLVNGKGGLSGVAHVGLRPEFIQAVNELPPEAHKTQFVMAGKIGYLRYADLNYDPRIPDPIRQAEGLCSIAVLPLLNQERVIANLTLGSHTREEFSTETRSILESIAAHLGNTLARVKAETDLALSEARVRAVLQAVPDLMIVLDQDGRNLDFKYDSEGILSMPAAAAIGRHMDEVFPSSVAERALEARKKALETRYVQQIEYDLTFADNKVHTFEARLSAASDTLVVALIREITDEHSASRQRQLLLEMERTLGKINADSLTAASPQDFIQPLLAESGQVLGITRSLLIVFDPDSQLASVTAQWEKPGYVFPFPALKSFSRSQYSHWMIQIERSHPILISGGEDAPGMQRLRELGICSMIVMPLFVQARLYGVLIFENHQENRVWASEEITFVRSAAQLVERAIERFEHRKELERRNLELETNNLRLLNLDRLKSQFLASVSHELRTPLNSIIGFSEVLADEIAGPLNPDQHEYLEDIHHGGLHLLALINDLLDYSKIEANRMNLDRTTLSIAALVGEVRAAFEPLIQKNHQTLAIDLPDCLPEIRADRLRLKQILFNLVGNAHKFTPPGGKVRLSVSLAPEGMKFCVEDTGPGISAEDQEIIFDEFRQADGSHVRASGGTGLGLAITKRLVLLHGGQIWVESSLGQGARFCVLLPLG